jgi:hypothetical protein
MHKCVYLVSIILFLQLLLHFFLPEAQEHCQVNLGDSLPYCGAHLQQKVVRPVGKERHMACNDDREEKELAAFIQADYNSGL